MARPYFFKDTLVDNVGRPREQEDKAFNWLIKFLDATRAAQFQTARLFPDGRWWVQFRLDLTHKRVWHILQELSYLANNPSLFNKLPTKLIPWSGSPENGPPKVELVWRIECYDGKFSPDDFVAEVGSKVARSVTRWPPKD